MRELLTGVGLFHQGHHAADDCHALLEVLAYDLPNADRPALAALLERSRRKTNRIWAGQSPFVRIRARPPCEKVGCVADCPYGRT
jgi:hypothetical protein